MWFISHLQRVSEGDLVSAGAGAAAELDQSGGGGQLEAVSVLVPACRWRERAGRSGDCSKQIYTAVHGKTPLQSLTDLFSSAPVGVRAHREWHYDHKAA